MLTAFTDGACRKDGRCSAAYVIYEGDAEVYYFSMYLGPEPHTNNYAEYEALILLLGKLHCDGTAGVTIYSDSKLVVNQVNQKWRTESKELKPLAMMASGLLIKGAHRLLHVKGHNGNRGNERADQLASEVLDRQSITGC
jgi:ribonuclease HI